MLNRLSPAERLELKKRLAVRENKDKQELIMQLQHEFDAKVRAFGLAISEVIPGGTIPPRKHKAVHPQKYRNPENYSQTWTGRGKPPHWIVALEKKNVDRSICLIDELEKPYTHIQDTSEQMEGNA